MGIGTDVVDCGVVVQGDMRDNKIFICEIFHRWYRSVKRGRQRRSRTSFWMCEKVRKSRISDSSPTPDRKIPNVTSVFLVDSGLTRVV